MLQTSEEVIQWVNDQLKEGVKPGLERMNWFMEKLDHPERRLRTVHIGGTNGKGSTAAFLRSIVQTAEYVVGTFTSPSVESFRERIAVNGKPIPEEDFVKTANVIKPLADELSKTDLGAPTEFEILTAMAVYYFVKIHPVDLAVFEVGMGGKDDATNIIHPFVTVITNIGTDHTGYLGSTREEIAGAKAGLIKNGVPVVTAVTEKEIFPVIEETAKLKRSGVYRLNREFSYQDLGPENGMEQLIVKTPFLAYEGLSLRMAGRHQLENATLAVMTAEYLRQFYAYLIEEEHVKKGLQAVSLPGRFEVVRENPLVILDGAHNKEGMENLVNTLSRHYPGEKFSVLFAALKDKPLKDMVKALETLGTPLYFTGFDHSRAATAEDLYNLSGATDKEIVKDWAGFLRESEKNNENILICGSIYFIKEIKEKLFRN